MDFNQYQNEALKTAIYPDRGEMSGLMYAALGLGESGEVQNKIKKVFRDDGGVVTDSRRVEIVEELGGNLWYIAAVCSELGVSMDDVARINLDILASRKSRGVIHGSGDSR